MPNRRLQHFISKIPDLLAYYPLNEVAGSKCINWCPSTYGSYNGTITGTKQNQRGPRGRAYSFNGTSDGIVLTGLTLPSVTGFTFGTFVNLPALPDVNDRIMDWSDGGPSGGYSLAYITPGIPTFIGRNVAVAEAQLDGTLMALDKWYFIAFTFQVNQANLYQQGELVAQDTSCTVTAATQTVCLMRRSATNTNWSNGLMQHTFMVNRVLSASEIKKIATLSGI